MYIRIINQQPVWPYSPEKLRQDEKDTSFPVVMTENILEEFNVFKVTTSPKPETTYEQNAVILNPVFEDGKWVQHWSVVDVNEEIKQERYERKCGEIRSERDRLLQECDWTQSRDIPESLSLTWQPYRQQLRDITEQIGFPFNVDWPVQPG